MAGGRWRFLVALAVVVVLVGPAAMPTRAAEPIRVVATFSILGDLVQTIGGDRVVVTTIVGADTDSHEYEPTPADAVAIAQAQVLFASGLGFEEWLEDVIEGAQNPNLRRVTLSDGLPVLGKGGPNPEFAAGNPHLWLDVTNTMAYVRTIRDTLKDMDSDGSALYDANAASYLALLADLDNAIWLEIQKVPEGNRKLMTFHDAWPYFCQRYGLQCFAVLQSTPEGEPSAQEYAELVALIQREGIKVIFGEAGFNPKLIEQLARDTGIEFVDDLHGDTLASEGLPSTYVGMMQYDISLIEYKLR